MENGVINEKYDCVQGGLGGRLAFEVGLGWFRVGWGSWVWVGRMQEWSST